jgi:hypothetical protein
MILINTLIKSGLKSNEKIQHTANKSLENKVMVISLYIKHTKYITGRGPLMVAQWFRYCATNRKAAGSIPDDVIFH